jgi:hypothetical protein
MFTYGNVGNDTSVMGAGGASVMADTVKDDEDEPGHLSIKKNRYGQRYVPSWTDNADAAAGNSISNVQAPGHDSAQPFDEANDDMDQDLDAFAAELERAKAAAKYLKARYNSSSSPSPVKSDFTKSQDDWTFARRGKLGSVVQCSPTHLCRISLCSKKGRKSQ